VSLDRIKDAMWFTMAEKQSPLIVGQGGIGSWLSLSVSRTGCSYMKIVDYDLIESHNLTGQFFKESQIGLAKVRAVVDNLYDFSRYTQVDTINFRYDPELLRPIVFGALDNMKTRRYLFETWFERYEFDKNALFIDGRLTAEQFQIFSMTGVDAEKCNDYKENHLFDDSEVTEERCTFKQTTHMAMMIAGLMTGIYTNHLANMTVGESLCDIPYLTEFMIPMCMFKREDVHDIQS